MGYTLAYLGQENAGKRKLECSKRVEIEITSEQYYKLAGGYIYLDG